MPPCTLLTPGSRELGCENVSCLKSSVATLTRPDRDFVGWDAGMSTVRPDRPHRLPPLTPTLG
jgi:hypothetical protein